MPAIPDSPKRLLLHIKDRLEVDESQEEKISLSYMLMEHLFNLNKTDVTVDRSVNVKSSAAKKLDKYIARLNDGEPIQYVLGEASFYGRNFVVNSSVLIPRPETEELVRLIINENSGKKIKLLDIGTGTGCIPITLTKEMSHCRCFAVDVDPRVIKVARQNADRHQADIQFMLLDILNETIKGDHTFDVIVSNPPYVTESERTSLKVNVRNFEPGTALYVPDSTPLVFYDRIASLAQSLLKPGGRLYFEINEKYGAEINKSLTELGYDSVEIIKDLNGRPRIAKALKPLT